MAKPTRKYRQTARAEAVRRNRRRVLEAARQEFLSKPYEDVNLQSIADRAELTVQTVLRYFGSKEGLLETTIEVIREAADASVAGTEVGDAQAALDGVLDRYESFGDGILRILSQEEMVEPYAALAELGRENHRAWIEEVFAPLLPPKGAPLRERRVLQLLVLLDVYAWKLLRKDHGADLATVRSALAELIEMVLAADD